MKKQCCAGLIISVGLMFLSGCIGIREDSIHPENIHDAKTVYIINNPDVQHGFLKAMEEWLQKHGYKPEVLAPETDKSKYEWVLTYYGDWDWHYAIYLADAKITAYKFGKYMGESTLNIPGGQFNINPSKFESAEVRINALMDNLYDRVSEKN